MSSGDAVFRRSNRRPFRTGKERDQRTDAGVLDPAHPRIVPGSAHPHLACQRLRPQGRSSAGRLRGTAPDEGRRRHRRPRRRHRRASRPVVRDIASIDVDDGVVFDLDTISVQEIREQADYPGLRVRVAVSIGPWKGAAAWDVSTGDPIVPPPRQVNIDRILGDPITLLGYAPETAIAEKGVTILERGIASTRWRDYVDIAQLARQGIDPDELLRSARASPTTAESPSNPSHASGRLRRSRTSEMGRMAPQGAPRIRLRGEPRRPDQPRYPVPRFRLCPRPRVDRADKARLGGDVRKTVATLIDDDGLSSRIGADHLGHSRVSMTQDRYMTRGRIHTQVADLLDRAVRINDE